jgi:hypothetical protein
MKKNENLIKINKFKQIVFFFFFIFSIIFTFIISFYLGQKSKINIPQFSEEPENFKSILQTYFQQNFKTHIISDDSLRNSFSVYRHPDQKECWPCGENGDIPDNYPKELNYFDNIWLPAWPFYDYKLGNYIALKIKLLLENLDLKVYKIKLIESEATSFRIIKRNSASLKINDVKFKLNFEKIIKNKTTFNKDFIFKISNKNGFHFQRQIFRFNNFKEIRLANKNEMNQSYNIIAEPFSKIDNNEYTYLDPDVMKNLSPLHNIQFIINISEINFYNNNPFKNFAFHKHIKDFHQIDGENKNFFDASFFFSSYIRIKSNFPPYPYIINTYTIYKIYCNHENLESLGLKWDKDGWIENDPIEFPPNP